MTTPYFDLDRNFSGDGTGNIRVVSGDEAIDQLILNLLSTRRGERLRRPTIGCAVEDLLFEPVDPVTAHQIETEIIALFDQQISRVTLRQVLVRDVYEPIPGYAVIIVYGNNAELNATQDAQLTLFFRSKGA